MNKRGYFFLIDAIIGSAIIVITLFIIFNHNSNSQKIESRYVLAEDFATLISNTRIEDINLNYTNTLVNNGKITNTKLRVIEQIAEFYYNGNISLAGNLTKEISDASISPKNGFSLSINGTTIYSRNINTLNNSKLVIVSKKIVFIQINSSDLKGPDIAEIKIWT